MDTSQHLGARLRAVRVRRAWRQEDLARRVGVDRSVISRIERGHLDGTTIGTLLAVARALDVQVSFVTRSRGADLDRLMNHRHAGLHESVVRWFGEAHGDWRLESEVSYAFGGERGVIDIVGWHPTRRAMVIIELKTDIVDVGDLLAQTDRRRRLARRIAAERGWDPATISVWVIVAGGRTNRSRIQRFRSMLRAAFPLDGRAVRAWLRDPSEPIAALSLWNRIEDDAARDGYAARHRVSRPRAARRVAVSGG